MSAQRVGPIAKLVDISADGTHHFLLPSGSAATGTFPKPLKVNNLYYLDLEGGDPVPAPASMWPESPRLGVVQHVGAAEVIVHAAGGPVSLPLPPDAIEVGNTVEFRELDGIRRVVSPTPLPLPTLDVAELIDISQFRKDLTAITDDFDDFVGDPETVRLAQRIVELPLTRAHLFDEIKAGPITGAVFHGPAGTGKTMLARIIARRSEAELFVLHGPDIVNKWYGTSERTLVTIFEAARLAKRAIIVLDEMDSLAPARTSDSHGFDIRVVSQLLTLLDGFEKHSNVMVIGTTNRLEGVEPALLRSSRFHWQVEFRLPNADQRARLLRQSAKAVNFEPEIDLAAAAARTSGWSGDDLAGIWREAQVLAVADGRGRIRIEDFNQALDRLLEQRASRQRTLARQERE